MPKIHKIWLYDVIGPWGISARQIVDDLNAAGAVDEIEIHLNSPGGDVFDAMAIYGVITAHPAAKTVYIEGLAASAASLIAMIGKSYMAENAMLMIHKPTVMAYGDDSELENQAELLKKIEAQSISIYARKSGQSEDQITAWMEEEKYFNAQEAKDAGFIDEIMAPAAVAASLHDWNRLGYKRKPPAFLENKQAAPAKGEATVSETTPTPAPAAETKAVTVSPGHQAAEIVKMCSRHNCPQLAAELLEKGLTPEQAGLAILDHVATQVMTQPASIKPAVDLTKKEIAAYSYRKAILAQVDLRMENKPWTGLEREVSDEISTKLPANWKVKSGVFLPIQLRPEEEIIRRPRMAGLDTHTATAGSELVFTQAGEFIDYLQNASVCLTLGATPMFGLTAPISFPKQTGAMTLYWRGENPGSKTTQSDITTGSVDMAAKYLFGLTSYSRGLLVQSTYSVEQMVRKEIGTAVGLAMDRGGCHGAGTLEPTGLYIASDVNVVAFGGAATKAKLVEMQTAVATDNALIGECGYATTPGAAGAMRGILRSSVAGAAYLWEGNAREGQVEGYRAMASNQIKSTLGGGAEHGILFGVWPEMVIGMWGGVEIIVDPYALKSEGMIEVSVDAMGDIGIKHGQCFARGTGLTA